MDLRRNKYGYFEVKKKPSEKKLSAHYEKKYFQEQKGHYEKEYTQDELLYIENEGRLAKATLEKYGVSVSSLLDLGCGEGFFSDYFFNIGTSVKLVDFSSFGLEAQNAHLLPYFEKSSIYDFLQSPSNYNDQFDLVNLDNVLEHVIDPSGLLELIKSRIHSSSLLRIEVPNDFSPMQQDLLQRGLTTETWVSIPEHLSYFGVDSLQNLVRSMGFKIVSTQMTFPIEVFLYNTHSNYYLDGSVGKDAHVSRLNISNHLAKLNIHGWLEFVEASSLVQIGRTIVLYARKI